MVRKLMKHELYALFRVLVFFAVAVVVFAAVGRLLVAASLNRADDESIRGITVFVVTFYVFSMLAFVVAAWALGINRFYRTLFTGEGDMTLSLPATPVQIVIAKLLSAIIMTACAALVSALSVTVFMIGWSEGVMETVGSALVEVFKVIFNSFAREPLLGVESVLIVIVSIPMSLLVVYAIISLGQLFTAHRKGMTWLLVFGVYIVGSILDTVGFQPLLALSASVSPHLAMCVVILTFLAIDIGCFFLIRHILKNKVNLIA